MTLKFLDSPDGEIGPEPCALTCSGVSRYNETGGGGWLRSWTGKAFKKVDIKGCGFVTRPIVIAITNGPEVEKHCPSLRMQMVHYEWFGALTVEDTNEIEMRENKCDVYWTANGFNCL